MPCVSTIGGVHLSRHTRAFLLPKITGAPHLLCCGSHGEGRWHLASGVSFSTGMCTLDQRENHISLSCMHTCSFMCTLLLRPLIPHLPFDHSVCRQMRDGGNLLTRAGFALPTVDCDTFVLKYAADHSSDISDSSSSRSSSSEGISDGGMRVAQPPVGPEALVAHLRQMGESNAIIHRQRKLHPDAVLAVSVKRRTVHL